MTSSQSHTRYPSGGTPPIHIPFFFEAAIHEVAWIAPPQEQTHPTGRAAAPGKVISAGLKQSCPMNLPSAVPPGQAKTPPPVWVTSWFSMSNFANLSKILMKPVRRSRW
jgi:hypothetical protein